MAKVMIRHGMMVNPWRIQGDLMVNLMFKYFDG